MNAVKAYSDYEANGIRYQCHISHRLDQQLEQLKAKGAGDNPALSSGNQSSAGSTVSPQEPSCPSTPSGAHLSSTVDALGSLSLNDEQQLPKQPASARRVPTVQQVNNLTQPNGLKPKVDSNGAPPAAMNGHRRGGLPQQPSRQQGLYPQQNYAYPPSSFPAFLPPQSSYVQQVEDSDFGPLGGRPGGAFLRQRPDNLLAGPYGNFERENGSGFLPNGFNDRGSNLGKPFVSNSQYIYDDSSFPSNGYSDAPPSMLSFPSGHAYSSGPSGNGQFYEGPGPYMPGDESDSRSFNRGRNQMADRSQTRSSDFDRAVNPNPMGSAYSIPQDVYRNERPGDELPLSYFSSVPTNLHHSNQPPMIYNPSTFLGPQGGMQIYSMSPIGSNATLTLQNPLLDNNMYFVQTGPSSLSSPVGTISPLSQSPAMQVRPLHPLNAFNPLLQSPAMQSPMSQQYHIFSGCDVHYSPMPSRSLEFYGGGFAQADFASKMLMQTYQRSNPTTGHSNHGGISGRSSGNGSGDLNLDSRAGAQRSAHASGSKILPYLNQANSKSTGSHVSSSGSSASEPRGPSRPAATAIAPTLLESPGAAIASATDQILMSDGEQSCIDSSVNSATIAQPETEADPELEPTAEDVPESSPTTSTTPIVSKPVNKSRKNAVNRALKNMTATVAQPPPFVH